MPAETKWLEFEGGVRAFAQTLYEWIAWWNPWRRFAFSAFGEQFPRRQALQSPHCAHPGVKYGIHHCYLKPAGDPAAPLILLNTLLLLRACETEKSTFNFIMPLKVASMAEKLSKSQIYKDYERAFGDLTGLPLSLRAGEVFKLVQHSKKHENPFCALLATENHSCAECLRVQDHISRQSGDRPVTATCFAGLCDTVVPIKVGDLNIGFLQTGQVFLKAPTRRRFQKAARQLIDWGSQINLQQLEDAYFHSRILSPKQYRAVVRLLEVFAKHLTVAANELVLSEQAGEPRAISGARRYITEHQGEKMSLGQVARAVNTSSYHFCRIFKNATGLNFTEYLSRVRVEKAKNLLLNPNLRVTEIGYGVGFQSLSHFNRVFRKITGSSPTSFRKTRRN